MGKYFVIRQSPPTTNSFEPRKNSTPVAFSCCVYMLQQIPIEGFHFASAMHSDLPYESDTEGFEVTFTRTVEIAVPVSQAPTAYSIGKQAALRKIHYALTINATPLLPLANDLEPMFWFLEEVTKAEYENGVRLIKLPALTSRLNADVIQP